MASRGVRAQPPAWNDGQVAFTRGIPETCWGFAGAIGGPGSTRADDGPGGFRGDDLQRPLQRPRQPSANRAERPARHAVGPQCRTAAHNRCRSVGLGGAAR